MTACEPWLPPRISDRLAVARVAARRPRRGRGTTRRTGLPTKRTLRRANARGRLVEGDEHAPHEPSQHAVGEPGQAVLLLDRRRVAEQRRREHQRPRGVAAHAQHDVGPVAPQDARATRRTRPAGAPSPRSRPPQAHALEAAHRRSAPAGSRPPAPACVSRPRAVPTNTASPPVAPSPPRRPRCRDRGGRPCRRPRSAPAAAASRHGIGSFDGGRAPAVGSPAALSPTSTMMRGPASMRRLAPLSARRRAPGSTQSLRLGVARRDVAPARPPRTGSSPATCRRS